MLASALSGLASASQSAMKPATQGLAPAVLAIARTNLHSFSSQAATNNRRLKKSLVGSMTAPIGPSSKNMRLPINGVFTNQAPLLTCWRQFSTGK
ncbi:unnamed protein product [Heterosigma akashiwo]